MSRPRASGLTGRVRRKIDRTVGLAPAVVEAEALVEGAGHHVVLARAEVHVVGALRAGKLDRGLHPCPPDALASVGGYHVQLCEVALERSRPTRCAVSRTISATLLAFCARRCPRSGRQRQTSRSPWSRTSKPCSESRAGSPASRSAAGASSCPGANAAALVGTPITPSVWVIWDSASVRGEPNARPKRVRSAPAWAGRRDRPPAGLTLARGVQ